MDTKVKKYKLLFIVPRDTRSSISIQASTKSFRKYGIYQSVPLGIPILASLTPAEFDINFINEYYKPIIDYSKEIDIVAISFITMNANRAYEVSDKFREMGSLVVMGGVHTSILPEESLQHADTVFIGEAEETWPEFLMDFRQGRVKELYRAERFVPPEKIPIPRWDIMESYDSTIVSFIQASRGCPYKCDFCNVPGQFGEKIRYRPIKNIIQEIKEILKINCSSLSWNTYL